MQAFREHSMDESLNQFPEETPWILREICKRIWDESGMETLEELRKTSIKDLMKKKCKRVLEGIF